MAGARGLWRATGMKDEDFGKPIIAVVNSFTQFVPGHVHLKDLGQLVARQIEASGGVAKEFNTIAVDDGIVDFIKKFLSSDHPNLSIDIFACIYTQKAIL